MTKPDYRGAAMEMQVRGWRAERTFWTRDTMGRDVSVSTGLTRDRDGRLVAVIAIGADGPSAIIGGPLDTETETALQADIAAALQDLKDSRQAGR